MFKFLANLFIFCLLILVQPLGVHSIVNPFDHPNNKFGIHIMSPSDEEILPSVALVNSSGGDWGYITVVIESDDRDVGKWQKFFDTLRASHLIPIVRLAGEPKGESWQRPADNEDDKWAEFLNSLNWPVKNRYVSIYNEPNHGVEWGGSVDAGNYAKVLSDTIDALKNKSSDFFVLNAGFDASSPQKLPDFADEASYISDMQKAVPGIFDKLDGWNSHSYPNPDFSGKPTDTGRGTIRTWMWEKDYLKSLDVKKDLPVFITETGWRHAEGITYNPQYPTALAVSSHFDQAFTSAWSSNQIIAITPFVLAYNQAPFDHFSFKKQSPGSQTANVLGDADPNYYPAYQTILQIDKQKGIPAQVQSFQVTKNTIPKTLNVNQEYSFKLTLKNTGQSIWGDRGQVILKPVSGSELGFSEIKLPEGQKIKPGESHTFELSAKTGQIGQFPVKFQLYDDQGAFDASPAEQTIQVKDPPILYLKTSLRWKKDFAGTYFLGLPDGTKQKVEINDQGQSNGLIIPSLSADSTVKLTLERPNYKSTTVEANLVSGKNEIDFGDLDPVILGNLFHPLTLWSLLPFSN